MDEIIRYLKKKYDPISIIIYGSYANGTNNENSHNLLVVGGIQLDVFIYSEENFQDNILYEDFLQISDGIIVWDTNEYGKNFKAQVAKFVENVPRKTDNDIQNDIAWCKKMLLRTKLTRGLRKAYYG